MTKGIKQGESCLSKLCSADFKGRCLRTERIANATYKYYSEYISAINAEKRVEEVRSVVSDQFSGISQMLLSLANDFDTDERFDAAAASRISAALKNINIIVKECGVRLDKNDRMTVEIRLKTKSDTVLNRAMIMHALCAACDRDFDPPCITVAQGDTWLVASEHALFSADVGVKQICSENSAICGDAYEYFFDGKGKLIMILSDGMGTGGRAAVDGAMATGLMSRLLKAGFDYNASLKILNSSMLFKSTDESTATLDVVAIDLFTGKTELLKAGAAPTLIRRSGKTSKAQSNSLPAGILRDIGFDKAVITLRRGDIVVMVSDGAVSEDSGWICEELEKWGNGTAQNLSEHIAHLAANRRSDGHTDDITVIAAIIDRA
jgi:stage II sporulation protein E